MKNRKSEAMAAAMFLFVLMLFALLGIQTATNLSEEMRTTHHDDIICNKLTGMDFIRAFLQIQLSLSYWFNWTKPVVHGNVRNWRSLVTQKALWPIWYSIRLVFLKPGFNPDQSFGQRLMFFNIFD